ncbi:MAG: phosphatidylglycerophosphatase A [Candidatus Omnitrophica bacterium]|nr:phosphatidylglycerophosphatase A [Candidatus Omnitrophota bacterium]
MPSLVKLAATAGGLGYSPIAPGTVGSVLGVALAWVTRDWPAPWALGVWLAACAASIPIATRAERAFGRLDPSAIVLDEVVAMWGIGVCYPLSIRSGWGIAAAAFLLFRAFDIVKPPPLRRLARLPGGWGVVFDDLGAAVYTGLILWAAVSWR